LLLYTEGTKNLVYARFLIKIILFTFLFSAPNHPICVCCRKINFLI
jgi:hypothetical protein